MQLNSIAIEYVYATLANVFGYDRILMQDPQMYSMYMYAEYRWRPECVPLHCACVQYTVSTLVYSVAPEYIPGIANVFDYDGILMQYPIGIPSLSNTILALANVFCLSRIHS